jgi:hypothetical protein
MKIEFTPRWKEELVATSQEGILIFEFTMGKNHVYFPSQNKWMDDAPAWAKDKWNEYLNECKKWCSANNIPITIVDNGWMYEEKR